METQTIQTAETKPAPKVRCEHWELYSSMAGWKAAERDLTRTGIRAEADLLKKLAKAKKNAEAARDRASFGGFWDGGGRKDVIAIIAEVFQRHFGPKLDKYGKYGAWDTEPRDHGKAWLRTAACEFIGLEEHAISIWDI